MYALAECVKCAIHFNHICDELGIDRPVKTPIWCDATAAIAFMKNLGGTSQTKLKHLDLRKDWLNQETDKVEIGHIDGKRNPANFFTKVLSPTEFAREGENLMGTIDVPESVLKELADIASRKHGEMQSI